MADIVGFLHRMSVKTKLPTLQPDLPTRPWEKLCMDIFEFNSILLIVKYLNSLWYDYYVTLQQIAYAMTLPKRFYNMTAIAHSSRLWYALHQ